MHSLNTHAYIHKWNLQLFSRHIFFWSHDSFDLSSTFLDTFLPSSVSIPCSCALSLLCALSFMSRGTQNSQSNARLLMQLWRSTWYFHNNHTPTHHLLPLNIQNADIVQFKQQRFLRFIFTFDLTHTRIHTHAQTRICTYTRIYMFMCPHQHTHTFTYTHTHKHTHAHTHMYTYIYKYINIYAHTKKILPKDELVFMKISVCVCVSVYVFINRFFYTYICTHVCVYFCIYTYRHTDICMWLCLKIENTYLYTYTIYMNYFYICIFVS